MKILINIKIFLVLLGFLFTTNSYGQDVEALLTQQEKSDSLSVRLAITAKYYGDSILVRWAPDKPGGWSLLNRVGYVLQRSEIDLAGKAENWVSLESDAIKPQPLEKWSKFGDQPENNTYPLIAAQAIWGETFSQNGQGTFSDKVDELTNRYAFALLASDLSFETAIYAGLAYVDKNVEPNKIYAYRIFAADSLKNYLPVDTGSTAIKAVKEVDFGAPYILKVDEEEQAVVLYWDKEASKQKYTAYYIERSEDGSRFQRLNEQPYILMDNEALDYGSTYFTFKDSLQQNYKPYWYRLIGIDAFGQVGSPSEAVKAIGRDKTPPPAATNVQATLLDNGQVEISWESENHPDLVGFYIGRSSENSLSGYQPLIENNLPKSARKYVDQAPFTDKANYYIILSLDSANNASASMASLLVFVDTIPPAIPQALEGSIDSLGIVSIRWQPNIEADIAGYVVSYSNDSTHFFTSAVDSLLKTNFFVDSLSLATLSEEIYYRVRAVDRNHNNSKESSILVLKKPDRIPPVPAQFVNFKQELGDVSLEWVASTSKDVVEHILYRRLNGQQEWETLISIPIMNPMTSYVDSTFKTNARYEYIIRAKDDAGLLSEPSSALHIRTLDRLKQEGVSESDAKAQDGGIRISWVLPNGNVKNCVWYRAVNGGAFQTLQSFDKKSSQFIDKSVIKGNRYEYACKVIYENGKTSSFSRVMEINY